MKAEQVAERALSDLCSRDVIKLLDSGEEKQARAVMKMVGMSKTDMDKTVQEHEEEQYNKADQELVDLVESELITIPDHWDTGGEITASSCPEMEFHLWRVHAKGDAEWSGEEFTLQTFEDYIDKLKEEDN